MRTITFDASDIFSITSYLPFYAIHARFKRLIFSDLSGSPKVQPLLFPPNVKSGLSTRTICTVERGEKPLNFIWKYNNREITDSELSVTINSFEDYTVLIIDPVSSKNSGNYTCVVKNVKGEDSFTATLLVQGKK